MATYLLTWNPARFDWKALATEARKTLKGALVRGSWSCGNSRSIEPGDRLFLLKQGTPPRGIVASGTAISDPFDDPHWDRERREKGVPARYVELEFDTILDPAKEPVLDVAGLQRGNLADVHWRTQVSGISIPGDAAKELEHLWRDHVDRVRGLDATSAAEDALRARGQAKRRSVGGESDSTPDEDALLRRITVNPAIFGGKPLVRGRRLAVEHVLGMLAAGDTVETLILNYTWLEPADVQACLVYARRVLANERIAPLRLETV